MNIILTSEKEAELEGMHNKFLSLRHANRIKEIFLVSEGWQPVSIAQAFRLTEETVRKHIRAYLRSEKLTNAYKGTEPRLDKGQETELIQHLESRLYPKMEYIRASVAEVYGFFCSHQGMHNGPHRNGFF